MNKIRLKRFRKAKNSMAILLIGFLFFFVIEGFSSATIAVFEMASAPQLSAPSHYDKSLGWVGIPKSYFPDFYGRGKYVRINARGFRNDTETMEQSPQGKLRVICSGDSFTFGQGVANNRTWCHRLSELNDSFDSINLGQPGFGVDQMYLRYLRDGIVLQHSIHIFAFVGGDFNRMRRLDQHRHGKPILEVKHGELTTRNVPVPRFRWWVARGIDRADFRSIDFAQRVGARLIPRKPISGTGIERIGPVASRVFQNIKRLCAEQNVVPVFVFLPTEDDIVDDSAWRLWVLTFMQGLEAPFVDLTPALRNLPAQKAATFFIPEEIPAAGHYTEAGNDWVAETLDKYFLEFPSIVSLLDSVETTRN